MGRILDEITRKMMKKVELKDKDPLKILVHSTHDTAIAALCSTLDVFDEKRVEIFSPYLRLSMANIFFHRWPAFSAAVTFELFKKNEPAIQTSYLQNIVGSVSPFGRKNINSDYCKLLLVYRVVYFSWEFLDIRMRYQNRNMFLPICSEDGKHFPGSPEFCTLAAFRERVKELTPDDFEAECAPAGRWWISIHLPCRVHARVRLLTVFTNTFG